jgi:hypothetical protein
MLFIATYASSIVVRTLARRRIVVPFEIVQTPAVLAIGLGGAVVVTRGNGAGHIALGAASALLAVGCYAAALACWRSRHDLRANFYFYATVALVLALTACGVLLRDMPLVAVLAGLAVVNAWIAQRFLPAALLIHSAVYCLIAAVASGLLTFILAAFVNPATSAWSMPNAAAALTLLTAAVCLAMRAPSTPRAPDLLARLPRLLLAALTVFGSAAVVIVWLAPHAALIAPADGVLPTLRTTVLAVGIVLLALATLHERSVEVGWLLYPVIVLSGLKLLVEDFRYSEPATLFLALGAFGAALVGTARIVSYRLRSAQEAAAVEIADSDLAAVHHKHA